MPELRIHKPCARGGLKVPYESEVHEKMLALLEEAIGLEASMERRGTVAYPMMIMAYKLGYSDAYVNMQDHVNKRLAEIREESK